MNTAAREASSEASRERPAVTCNVCGLGDPRVLFVKNEDTYVECAGCGLIYLNPQPSETELAEVYGEHYYDAWGLTAEVESVRELKHKTFRLLLDHFCARTGVRAGALLDVGCASGFLLEVAQARGFEPFGIELNSVSATQAQQKFGKERIHCGTIDTHPFRSSSFSVVVMSDLLEHVRSPRNLLNQISDLLLPNGHVAILAPNVGALSRRLLGSHWTDFKREHLFYFNPRTLTSLLNRSSFHTLEVRPFPKYLNLTYIHNQLSKFHTPLLSEIVHFLYRAAPEKFARRSFRIFAGSMLAIAHHAPKSVDGSHPSVGDKWE